MKTNSSPTQTLLETKAPRIIALIALATLLLFALTGCKNAGRSTAKMDPSGVYQLISVDGKTLPCKLAHEGTELTLKTGKFVINTNGTCVSFTTFSVAGRPEIHRQVEATYILQGLELTMKWKRAGITVGRIEANRFTMNNEGMIFSYQKQVEGDSR